MYREWELFEYLGVGVCDVIAVHFKCSHPVLELFVFLGRF